MKILAFSDSHHDMTGMMYPIQEENPDVVIHLGDNADDASRLEKMFPDIKLYSVRGNCDFVNMESEQTFKIDDFTFFITHGHKYSVKSTYDRVIKKGLKNKANFIMFGHTHIALCQYSNAWVINPGSSSRTQTRDRHPSYCKIIIENGDVKCNIVTR